MPGTDPKPPSILKTSNTTEASPGQSMSVRDSLQTYGDNQLRFFARLLFDFLKTKNSHDKLRMKELNEIQADLGKDKGEAIEDIMNLVAFSNRFYSDPLITSQEKTVFYNRLEELKTQYLSGNIDLFPKPSLETISQNTSSLSARKILRLTKEVYQLLGRFSKEYPDALRKRDICFYALNLLAMTVHTAIKEGNPGKFDAERMIQRLQSIIRTFRERTKWGAEGEENFLNELTSIENRYKVTFAKLEEPLPVASPQLENTSGKSVHFGLAKSGYQENLRAVKGLYYEKRNDQHEKRNSTFLYRPAKIRNTQIKGIAEILAMTETEEGKVNALNQIKADIQKEINWLDSALGRVIDELIGELETGHGNTPSNMSPR